MAKYFLIKDDKIIDHVIAEEENILKNLYPECSILIDDKNDMGIGWHKFNDYWRPPMPQDDREWRWNEQEQTWICLNPVIIEEDNVI